MNYKETLEIIGKLCSKEYKYTDLDKVYNDLNVVKMTLHTCRNELCLHCGKYKHEHNGACEGCIWK